MSLDIFMPIFSGDLLLPLIIAAPLAGIVLILLLQRWPNLRELATLITAGATFFLVARLLNEFLEGTRHAFTLPDILPGLALAWNVEPLGLMFALIASGLWIINSLYSFGYMRGNQEERQTQFYVFFAVAIAATLGIALAGNLLTLFIFYEMLTLSTWPLVAHKQTPEARAGGRTYMAVLLATSIGLFLVAMVWTWSLAETLDFTAGGILPKDMSAGMVAALLALFIFGTGKAALMPFHRWLPAAMVAPTPVSALLHAVAVVKAGVFVVLKVGIYIFGLSFLKDTGASDWLVWLAGFSIFAASVIALTKTDLKARLAYSTVSQLSYITLGLALATPLAAVAAALHILTHAFGKITLFMCAGAIYTNTHKKNINEMVGLGWAMPATFIAFTIGALSITGLPPLAGMWSKWMLLEASAQTSWFALGILIASSLLNALYLVPVGLRGFSYPHTQKDGLTRAPLFCVLPPVLTAIGCLALFFMLEPIADFLSTIQFEKIETSQ